MGAVNVTTEITIDRPRAEVAAYASNPDNAPEWYVNIKAAEWKTAKPLQPGSQIAFIARFLGRELSYTYEIVAYEPERRLVMRTAQGPFPMETTYTWQDTPDGKTLMTLQNAGRPSGFSGLFSSFMAMMMKQANRKDLALLKQILEKQ